MDIVTSGDALESQILEDARAKARRRIESADKECDAIRAEWDRRYQAAAAQAEAGRDARIAALRQELAASLPLDFMRSRLAFIQETMSAALKDLFDGLSPEGRTRILEHMLKKASAAFAGMKGVVYASGIEDEEARRIVGRSIPGLTVEKVAGGEALGTGIIIEASDRSRRFRATLEEISSLLLEDLREELVVALFGKDVTL
jgi:vacuolar-type H+-ATPase subunit E/Vma4